MKKRLAIVTTHPIQYQAPIWRRLAQYPDLEVHVYFGSDFSIRGYKDSGFGVEVKWDVPLTEGYAHTFLSTDPQIQGTDGFFTLRASHLTAKLKEFQPHCALVCGYLPFFYLEAIGILRARKIPVLLRMEATDENKLRSIGKDFLRSQALRFIYSQCAHFLAIGKNAEAHYLLKGVPPNKITKSLYCINSDSLADQVLLYRQHREKLRMQMGFGDAHTVFVISGKLLVTKGLLEVIGALQTISETARRRIGLIVLGDGDLRPEFQAQCESLLGSRAVFTGFQNQSQIGKYYAAADCLLFPSWSETWGLVVNEALQFGLPAIVSDKVGSHRDLIVEGQTGFAFPSGDTQQLKEAMIKMMDLLHQQRSIIAKACQQRVSHYTVEAASQGIHEAVLQTTI
ncbi:MAG: glycosyltransferase family 4 protein [Abitibacteriaceae bacterium]|nr:glycosyltransferase family 4 protein [Abditibacteriaceae bacterium]MBV9866479.1 glycosyltransferase family 4 protein [Abditibacteriaceae bacterium]